jgi:uncharacterized SAM-binding protein YcdF (DUF218 family)
MEDSFFYLSKLIWTVLSPDGLFVILLTLCLVLLLARRTRMAVALLSVLTIGVLLLSLFPLGNWLLYPLERRFQHNPELPQRVDGIIVLGGSVMPAQSVEWQQLETNHAHERLSSFIQLAQRYPEARLVFSGGNASLDRSRPTEAQVAESYFVAAGIPAERLIIDSNARNTAENTLYSKQLAKPVPDEHWLLITSAYHMPRAIGVFCRQDWQVIPYPVDHQVVSAQRFRPGFNLLLHAYNLDMAAHEWLGLLAYYLTGKTHQLLPAQCDTAE